MIVNQKVEPGHLNHLFEIGEDVGGDMLSIFISISISTLDLKNEGDFQNQSVGSWNRLPEKLSFIDFVSCILVIFRE